MNSKYIIGILYLLYAIVKISSGLAIMFLPLEIIDKTPILNIFVKEAADKTFAGRMYEYVLLAFGVFSLFEGLALLDQLSPKLTVLLESKWTEYTVFILLGIILTVFYSLVLYTDLPISKNKTDNDHYKILGLGGGISFLVMPLIWEFMGHTIPAFERLSQEMKATVIVAIAIIAAIIGELIYKYLELKKKTITQILPPNYQQNIQTAEEVKTTLSHTFSPIATKIYFKNLQHNDNTTIKK